MIPSRLLDSELADEIEFLTARARALGTRNANARLAELGLTVRSYAVLALAASGHSPSQRELAAFLSLDASQIVALTDQLEGPGLVARTPDPADRRTNAVTATSTGLLLYARARTVAREAEADSLAALSPTEQHQLRELLRRIAFDAPTGG